MVNIGVAGPKRAHNESKKITKKVVTKEQVSTGMVNMFTGVECDDLKYLMAGFMKMPELVPWLASLMRDGKLKEALQIKLMGEQHVTLGHKLGDKAKRFRNLSPRFWNILWRNIWATAPTEEESKEMRLEEHQRLGMVALQVDIDGLLPQTHRGNRFEGPLVKVFVERHKSVGSPLGAMTMEGFRERKYAYFSMPSPFCGLVLVNAQPDLKFQVFDEDKAKDATDWELVDTCTDHCALVSKALGFVQQLFPLVKRLDGAKELPVHLETFELPRAADCFPEPKSYRVADSPDTATPAVVTSSGSVEVDGVVVTPQKKRRSLSGH